MSGIMDDSLPFSLSPEPRLLYLTPGLRTALHKVRYVVDRRQGLTAILGDYGLGKSSLMRLIFDSYAVRDDTLVALIPSPNFKSDYAFLKGICREFGVGPRRSVLDQQHALEEFVANAFGEGHNVLLMIDEGQRLDGKQLEILRTLLNFETNERKLIQIVLAGQLELRDRLLEDRFGALRSRVFAPTLLSALSLLETVEMIAHRCQEAQIRNPFGQDAAEAVYELTAGVPRETLKVCAIAYELARLAGDDTIPPEAVRAAYTESTLTKPEAAKAAV
jgi:general secretion pathway protein A